MSEFVRYRFFADPADYRPVKFPTPGPYWCSGYADDDGNAAVMIAYLPRGVKVTKYWPEARGVEALSVGPIKFTDRFPKPDWWDSAAEQGEAK